MADATYINQGVYNKQGGNTKVIASGGKIEIESGGELEGQSGGSFDAQSGFSFYLAGDTTAFTVDRFNNFIKSGTTYTEIASGSYYHGAVAVLSISYGNIVISQATGASIGSVYTKLSPPTGSGAILKFYGSYMAANAVFWLSDNSAIVAGAGLTCYITNGVSTALSRILLSTGAFLELRYVSDTTWAVIRSSSCTESAAA